MVLYRARRTLHLPDGDWLIGTDREINPADWRGPIAAGFIGVVGTILAGAPA
jgi:hypothetical protein